ncbi:MAG: DUF1080 domain-containing protein, partial [Verrucomicrobiales bacterium]|nr:DUF1080 domain-containing protein [Verrucomicrobiales bacterium]
MNNLPLLINSIAIIGILAPALAEDPANWKHLFDGKSLQGWDGDPKFWKVEGDAITGTTTEENPTKGNTFI